MGACFAPEDTLPDRWGVGGLDVASAAGEAGDCAVGAGGRGTILQTHVEMPSTMPNDTRYHLNFFVFIMLYI